MTTLSRKRRNLFQNQTNIYVVKSENKHVIKSDALLCFYLSMSNFFLSHDSVNLPSEI